MDLRVSRQAILSNFVSIWQRRNCSNISINMYSRWNKKKYTKEEIDWSYIDYVDNQDILDLIENELANMKKLAESISNMPQQNNLYTNFDQPRKMPEDGRMRFWDSRKLNQLANKWA